MGGDDADKLNGSGNDVAHLGIGVSAPLLTHVGSCVASLPESKPSQPTPNPNHLTPDNGEVPL